jgi:hypothetical protein
MAQQSASRIFKKADIHEATEIPLHTFQHWFDRRIIRLSSDDDPGDGKGTPRRFGIRRVYQIAIAYRLSRLGVPANIAVTLAALFSDTPQHGREIGRLFQTGRTLLVATPDGCGRIEHLEPDQDIGSLLTDDAAIVVDLNKIISKINSRIGHTF